MRLTYRAFIAVLAVAACDEPTAPDIGPDLPDVRPHVIGEALAALDVTGRFKLTTPQAPGDRPIIGPVQASAIAQSFLRTIARSEGNPLCAPAPGLSCASIKAAIEAQRCRPIVWNEVSIRAERWFYGEPPTVPAPDTVPVFVHNHVGPRYHIPVAEKGTWIATISVAAYATNVEIRADGRLSYTSAANGNEFRVHTVTCDADAGTPPAPEEAVYYVARQTGRRISRVPYLLHPGRDVAAGGGRWKIVLDGTVDVRSIADGSIHTTDVLYVSLWPDIEAQATFGNRLRLMVPKRDQPSADVAVQWPDASGYIHRLELERLADRPIDFIEVVVVK